MPDHAFPDRVRAIAAMIRLLKVWPIERISERPMKAIYAALLGIAMTIPAHAAERTIKTEYLACNPERQFHLAERIRASGDAKALKAFTTGALLAGTCVALKPGATVFTAGSGKDQGVVKVRPEGSFKTFFTSESAFE